MKIKYIFWECNRLLKKIIMFLRGCWICFLYLTPNFVRTNGEVYLDCKRIQFGKNILLGANVRIFGDGEVVIGNNVMIGDGSVICSSKEIVIEQNTMIAAQCYLVDCNHGMSLTIPMLNQPISIGTVLIGEDCWIGCGCKILKNSRIQSGAIIGAGTVVTGEIPSNTICCSKRVYDISFRY